MLQTVKTGNSTTESLCFWKTSCLWHRVPFFQIWRLGARLWKVDHQFQICCTVGTYVWELEAHSQIISVCFYTFSHLYPSLCKKKSISKSQSISASVSQSTSVHELRLTFTVFFRTLYTSMVWNTGRVKAASSEIKIKRKTFFNPESNTSCQNPHLAERGRERRAKRGSWRQVTSSSLLFKHLGGSRLHRLPTLCLSAALNRC